MQLLVSTLMDMADPDRFNLYHEPFHLAGFDSQESVELLPKHASLQRDTSGFDQIGAI